MVFYYEYSVLEMIENNVVNAQTQRKDLGFLQLLPEVIHKKNNHKRKINCL